MNTAARVDTDSDHSGDVIAMVSQQLGKLVTVVALEFDAVAVNCPTCCQRGFEVGGQRVNSRLWDIKPRNDSYCFAIPSFVDANRNLLFCLIEIGITVEFVE